MLKLILAQRWIKFRDKIKSEENSANAQMSIDHVLHIILKSTVHSKIHAILKNK